MVCGDTETASHIKVKQRSHEQYQKDCEQQNTAQAT